MSLSDRETVFVESYLICWNATEAARRAGYKNPNKIGPRKLVEVGIKAAVAGRIGELKATADEVLLRLASHSRSSMDDFIGPLDTVDLDRVRERGKMHLIKKVKQHTTRISKTDGEDIEYHDIELELYDAQAATVQLARILGQFVERVEIYDWRKEAAQLGADPDSLADTLVAMIEQGANGTGPTA